ncbi:MAG: transcriptional regulator [Tistrella sp.]|nr:transcriptional regulator [Tistrella sp.]
MDDGRAEGLMKLGMRQLDAFQAVMTLGTVTSAANVLATSQPAVTRSIRQLEDATGLQLFRRVRGRLEPTADARELMETVRQSYAGIDRIAQVASQLRRRHTGHLRVGCLPAFAQGFIARTIADFLADHPKASLSVTPLMSSDVVRATRSREVDIGIAAYDIDVTGLDTRPFTDCPEIAVVPAGHPLADRQVVAPADLAGQPLVMLGASDPYRQRLDRLLAGEGVTPARLVETPTSSALCAMVVEGVGVGVVNPITALDFIGQGLVMLRLAADLPFVTTRLQVTTGGPNALALAFITVMERRRDMDLAAVAEALGPHPSIS